MGTCRRKSVAVGALCFVAALVAAAPATAEVIGPSPIPAPVDSYAAQCHIGSGALDCTLAQREGSSIDIADQEGVITFWRVRFGTHVPESMFFQVLERGPPASLYDSRRAVSEYHHPGGLNSNSINEISTQLPIHPGQAIGVAPNAGSNAGTRSSIIALESGRAVLGWDPSLLPGQPYRTHTSVRSGRVLTANATTVPPDPGRCADLNTFRGTASGDAYAGFQSGGDRIFGEGGADVLRGAQRGDCVNGGIGRDTLRGDSGRDRLLGGDGGDVIGSRDGQRDTVECGRGRDVVRADNRDVVRGCETVRR